LRSCVSAYRGTTREIYPPPHHDALPILEDILRIAGRHLIVRDGREAGDEAAPGLLLQAFAAALNETAVRDMLRDRMNERYQLLVRIVDTAKGEGGIDSTIDTRGIVTFCYALGMGFLLLEVLDLEVPDQVAWDDLLDRLLDSTREPGVERGIG